MTNKERDQTKAKHITKKKNNGRGGGQVVSMIDQCFDDHASNPAEI